MFPLKKTALPIAALAALALPSAASATTPSTYYASPSGTGSTCSSALPCSIDHAVNVEATVTGDEIILKPDPGGNNVFIHGNSSSLSVPTNGYLHGIDPGNVPTITMNTAYASSVQVVYLATGARASDLKISAPIQSSGSGANVYGLGMSANATANNVQVSSIGIGAGISGNGVKISNSTIRSTGPHFALTASGGTMTIQNSTLWAADPNARGIHADAPGGNTVVNVHNSIVRAGQYDADAASSPTYSTILNFDHSSADLNPARTVHASGAVINGFGTSGNQSAPPQLAAPTSGTIGDFHQLANSPTINAGSAPFSGFDIDHQAFALGCTAPDIGADEYAQNACVTAVAVLKLSKPGIKAKRKHGKVAVKITCPKTAIGTCSGSVAIKQGSKTKTTKFSKVKPGKTKTLKIKAKKGKSSITLTETDSSGAVGTITASKKLK